MTGSGPDFFCVGMPKSATEWLYDVFFKHRDFCMLPIKELHHFDANKGLKFLRDLNTRLGHPRVDRLPPEKVTQFKSLLFDYASNGFSDESYLSLFNIKEEKFSGDVTPAYCSLTEDRVRDIYRLLPRAKVILLIRHPIDRAWSHYNMELRVRARKVRTPVSMSLVEEISSQFTLDDCFAREAFVSKCFPSRTWDRWSIFGENFLTIGFEEVAKDPLGVARRAIMFVAGPESDPPRGWKTPKNKKKGGIRLQMSQEQRAFMEDTFRDEIRDCKIRFPEIAADW